MSIRLSHTPVRQAIRVVTPELSFFQQLLLFGGEAARIGYLIGRKIRILRKKENIAPLLMGSILDAAVGHLPSVQQVARIVFGSLSILRCSEDLLKIKQLGKRCHALFRGREYLVIKKIEWASTLKGRISPSIYHSWLWFQRVYLLQVKEAFRLLGKVFKQVALLGLHLADAYSAYRERNVSEIFVHGRDLWRRLTSDESALVKELKRTKKINDWMLARQGSNWTTKLFLNLLTLPNRLKAKLPDMRDVKKQAEGKLDAMATNIEAIGELTKDHSQRKYHIYTEGSSKDPNAMRFLPSPKRAVSI